MLNSRNLAESGTGKIISFGLPRQGLTHMFRGGPEPPDSCITICFIRYFRIREGVRYLHKGSVSYRFKAIIYLPLCYQLSDAFPGRYDKRQMGVRDISLSGFLNRDVGLI